MEENLAARDQRDSTRKAAPLKVVDGATVINNSGESPEETSARIIALVEQGCSSFYWLIQVFLFVLIGRCVYFGFALRQLMNSAECVHQYHIVYYRHDSLQSYLSVKRRCLVIT